MKRASSAFWPLPHWSPPSIFLGSAACLTSPAATAKLSSSPQNAPNQTIQTLLKTLSILINITEWKAASEHAGLSSDLVWSQLSKSRSQNDPTAHGRLTPPLQTRYLTPAPLTPPTSCFSKAGFGFDVPSLFLLKSIFTTENGFLMSFVPEFIC